MARLFYMSLPGVGAWDGALREAGAQLRPYVSYLETAIRVAKERKPVLAWRSANPEEREVFEARLDERYERQVKRAKAARKRRDRRVPLRPSGQWVVLEPPPWQPEEPEATFENFLDAEEVYDNPFCPRDGAIPIQDHDLEGLALLLAGLPEEIDPPASGEDEAPPIPTPERPFGALLFLRPNTYALDRQLRAVRQMENQPTPDLAPLVRLISTRPRWDPVKMASLLEAAWVFLRHEDPGLPLRDGTDEQRQFVEIALATPDFALLEGPPGSGKTTAICELIVQLARQEKRVLLCASTHVAVDNVLERLLTWQDESDEKLVVPVRIGDEDRVTSEMVVPWTFRRLLRTWRDELLDFLDDPRGTELEGAGARTMLREALQSAGRGDDAPLERLILESSNLVCGTTIGILQHPAIRASRSGEPFEPFDVMILDEASKTTLAEFLVPALHARRWIIVGDVRQLSPYVEEADLRSNLRGLVPEAQGRAAAVAFLTSDKARPRQRRLVLSETAAERHLMTEEAAARQVQAGDLDMVQPRALRGYEGVVAELLYADLVYGSLDTLRAYEHRLPGDLIWPAEMAHFLPDWEAHHSAVAPEAERECVEWAAEVSWRLVRSYELRQNEDERGRYQAEIDDLVPVTLDEKGHERLRRGMGNIRRVALPSILELLQRGFERLEGWRDDVALTAGLPPAVLEQRLVSLSFQHRMHPEISAFPRERFYVAEGSEPLLQDASTLRAEREWSYARYARRALWSDVTPRRGPRRRQKNRNPAEVDAVLKELAAFVEWAKAHPSRDRQGRSQPWEVAVLTYYRGQEALLRERLQALSGQPGNSRNFYLPRGTRAVHVTLCTVDRFQGHEADLVILSFVKSGSVGFLNSPNRLTVALTRARYQLLLVGHRTYFESERCPSPMLRALAASPHYAGDIHWETTP